MDAGFWILNDIVWVKTNPMPNFRGVRFTNAHETLIWAKRSESQPRYTFHYKVMKALNGGKQMRSDWIIPLCTGEERLRVQGVKAHSTQKPEALLERIILSCSSRGDVVLDPFFGTGTTGAVCKRFGRSYVGIERDADYVALSRRRIDSVEEQGPGPEDAEARPARLPFRTLVDAGLLRPNDTLRFRNTDQVASITADGRLSWRGQTGSIHRIGSLVDNAAACNGWVHWFYHDSATGSFEPIDRLRQQLRAALASDSEAPDEGHIVDGGCVK